MLAKPAGSKAFVDVVDAERRDLHRATYPKSTFRCEPRSATSGSGLPHPRARPYSAGMSTKSRERLYSSAVRASAERANEARMEADKLACDAWNKRMLGFQGPAQPSPMIGDALNAGCRYLEVRCAACDLHSTVNLSIIRRPKDTTPVHELERRLHCRDCWSRAGYRIKRGQLVALRAQPISATSPPSVWWPGER